MHNEDVVREFFSAYKQHAYPRIKPLLSPDVHFEDFAFDIHGPDVFAMWQWFCLPGEHRGPVEVPWFGNIRANGETVTAGYRVAYTYGEDRRPVDYVIRSTFTIEKGKIAKQCDRGSIFTWTRQAFGLPYALISWAPFFNARVRREARKKLDAFIDSTGATASNTP